MAQSFDRSEPDPGNIQKSWHEGIFALRSLHFEITTQLFKPRCVVRLHMSHDLPITSAIKGQNCSVWRVNLAVSAVFVLPIRWWMCVRMHGISRHSSAEKKSPTAALLDVSRHLKRTRAVSTYRYRLISLRKIHF